MPWILFVCAVIGCGFDADYSGGHYTCSDGVCPSGLSCIADKCVTPADAAPPIDAIVHALTCVDPGALPGTVTGSTAPPRMNLMTASCEATVMNGTDAVYKVTAGASQHIIVSVMGDFPAKAYVLQPCAPAPATPTCLGGTYAAMNNPISVATTAAGDYFVVVDCDLAADSGTYSMTVSVGP